MIEIKLNGGAKERIYSKEEKAEHEEHKKLKKLNIQDPDDITAAQMKKIVFRLAKKANII